VIAGNVATAEGARALILAGADGLKDSSKTLYEKLVEHVKLPHLPPLARGYRPYPRELDFKNTLLLKNGCF